jgi:hypothetical protein
MRRHHLLRSLSAARWLVLAGAIFATSCGGRRATVEGQVFCDGKPAIGAVVFFSPKGADDLTARRASGVVGPDGTFTLSTAKPGDGVAPGEYIVTIVWPEEVKTNKLTMSPEEQAPADRLQGRYADRSRSTLHATVKPGKNKLQAFEITLGSGPRR